MLQLVQFQKTGRIAVEELPAPQVRPGGVLVRNAFSLISVGTERTSIRTAQASLLGKARSATAAERAAAADTAGPCTQRAAGAAARDATPAHLVDLFNGSPACSTPFD